MSGLRWDDLRADDGEVSNEFEICLEMASGNLRVSALGLLFTEFGERWAECWINAGGGVGGGAGADTDTGTGTDTDTGTSTGACTDACTGACTDVNANADGGPFCFGESVEFEVVFIWLEIDGSLFVFGTFWIEL